MENQAQSHTPADLHGASIDRIVPPLANVRAVPLSEKACLAVRIATTEGPRAVKEHHIRLSIEEAELACDALRKAGHSVQPYDFPGTNGIWTSTAPDGRPYTQIAAREYLMHLGQKHGVSVLQPSGFKEILPEITVHSLRQESINRWGTTLGGLLSAYNSSPSAPFLELIHADPALKTVQDIGIAACDFPFAPNRYFIDRNGVPTRACLTLCKQLLQAVTQDVGRNIGRTLDIRNPADFKHILRSLDSATIRSTPCNFWGTTLATVLKAYHGSPSSLILALIQSDPEFHKIHTIGLSPGDFPKAPNAIWVRDEKPTDAARQQTRLLVEAIGNEQGLPNIHSRESFLRILSAVQPDSRSIALTYWGTTIAGPLRSAYQGNVYVALADLISTDKSFAGQREVFLEILKVCDRAAKRT